MTTKGKTIFRFVSLSGLFLLELVMVTAFWVVPQFGSREYNPHPAIGSEVETVLEAHPWLQIIPIAFLALFLFGNVGVIIMIWKAYKNLKGENG